MIRQLTYLILISLIAFASNAWAQDTVLVKTLGTGEFEEGVDIIYLQDSGIMVLGNVAGDEASAGDFLLARYDENNESVWVHRYGSEEPERSTTVFEASLGMYLVGGMSYALPPIYQAFVCLVDSNGDRLDAMRIGDRTGFSEVRAFVTNSSGDVYAIYNQWKAGNDAARSVYRAQIEWNNENEIIVGNPIEMSGTEGFELIQLKPSLNDGFMGVGSVYNDTEDAHFIEWSDAFQEVNSVTFSTDGEDRYNTVADHADLIIMAGYTNGYNADDRDVIVHKYTKDGVLYGEDVRGFFNGGPQVNDEALDAFFVNERQFLMTGYTITYGEGAGVTADLFMSLVDTGLYDVPGSTTLGGEQVDVGRKILPWRSGLLAVGYTDSYGEGLTDILIVQRDSILGSIEVVEQGDSLVEDSVFFILDVTDPLPLEQPEISWRAEANQMHVSTERENIQSVRIYDMLGRPLVERHDLQSNSVVIDTRAFTSQLAIIEVIGDGIHQSKILYLP